MIQRIFPKPGHRRERMRPPRRSASCAVLTGLALAQIKPKAALVTLACLGLAGGRPLAGGPDRTRRDLVTAMVRLGFSGLCLPSDFRERLGLGIHARANSSAAL